MTLNLSHLGIKQPKKKVEQEIAEAILLSRVSSKDQEENYSLDAQEKRLRDYCLSKNLQVIAVCSFAESSTIGNRPKFRDMIKQIKARKKPIAIICDKVDRLQRGFKETPMLEELRESGKAQLHFVSNNGLIIHKNSSSQEMLQYNFNVLLAKNYTDCISENVKRSHEQMVREGKAMSLAPLGYLNIRDPETKVANIILDEKRAFLVKRLFTEYATGLYSYRELTAMAKEWGLDNKGKAHKPLCKCQVEKILKNVFYCGYAKRVDEYYPHCYPTIVSMELFMKCVDVRKGRNKQFSKMTKHETVFKGLIKCANCGCTVTPDIKKGKYIYLKPNSKKGCNCKQINENVANDMVSNVFKAMSMPEDELQTYVEALRDRFKQTNDIQAREKLAYTKQLTVLNTRLDRLKKIYLDGDFSREEYLSEKQNIEIEQKTLENKIAELSTDNKEIEITLEYLLKLVSRANSLYESSRIEKKRKILKLVFSNFFLNGSNLLYELKKPFDMFVKRANRLKIWA